MQVFLLNNSSRAAVVSTLCTLVGVLLLVVSNSSDIGVQAATTTEKESSMGRNSHSQNLRTSSRRSLEKVEVDVDEAASAADPDMSNVTTDKEAETSEEEEYFSSLDEPNVTTCLPIVDVVCGHANWTNFCNLFKKVDAADQYYFETELSNSSKYTLFVPTDAAFGMVNLTLAEITPAQLLRTELFQVHEGQMLTYDDLDCGDKILMLSNDTSRTKCNKMVNDTSDALNNTIKYQTGNGNTKSNTLPKITDTDVYACNAIIHELDHVMYPVNLKEFSRNEMTPGSMEEMGAVDLAGTNPPTMTPTVEETKKDEDEDDDDDDDDDDEDEDGDDDDDDDDDDSRLISRSISASSNALSNALLNALSNASSNASSAVSSADSSAVNSAVSSAVNSAVNSAISSAVSNAPSSNSSSNILFSSRKRDDVDVVVGGGCCCCDDSSEFLFVLVFVFDWEFVSPP